MGQFSWLDCITERQIKDNKRVNVYVLVPKEFGGGNIKETYYDGYGRFGGNDIYDLVADWNREFAKNNPDFVTEACGKISDQPWYKPYVEGKPIKEIEKAMGGRWFEYRSIGIDLACYDEDNERLQYPIKITHDKDAVYENCMPSLSDPNQGW